MVQVITKFHICPVLFSFPSGFIEDNPDGLMKRDKLLGMYIDVLSNAKAKQFVNQIFSKYDTDNSGSIDFKVQFGTAYNRKMKCCFSHQNSPGIYDGDHNVWRSD